MTLFHAPYAWLGGDTLEEDVVIDTGAGVIRSVTSGVGPSGAFGLDGVVMPGLVSAHSHAFHRALRGRTHDVSGDFWSWRTLMYRAANATTPESLRLLATGLFVEMLEAGITTVGEFHYLHHRPDGTPYDDDNAMAMALVAAAVATGMRLTILDTCYLSSDAAGSPLTPPQRRFGDGTARAWRDRALRLAEQVGDVATVRHGVAAHSVRAVVPEDLAIVAATSAETQSPLHVHVSEQPAENEACMTEHGVSPTRLLADHGFLSERTTLVHATHTDAADHSLISASGARVCLCPTTERDLGDGIGPAVEMRAGGIALCLGSDSNAVVDGFEEIATMEMHDRLRLQSRGLHSPADALHSGTTVGMRSLGWPDAGLVAGAPADFIVIGMSGPTMAGLAPQHGVAALAYVARRDHVTDVIVAGEHVVENGAHRATGLRATLDAAIREVVG